MPKFQFLILISCLFISISAYGLSFKEDFTVVLIDSDTESICGAFPFDRSLLAKAVDRLSEAGAKGVVFKFFIDRAKDEKSDDQLAASFKKIPVLLQARIVTNEPADDDAGSNHLPERFTLKLDAATAIVGESGWIPNPKFADAAYDICFADFNGLPLSMLGKYQNQVIKSLLLCSIEMALGKKAVISPQNKADFGELVLQLDSENRVISNFEVGPIEEYIPFHTLLDGTVASSELRNKVVILAYDGHSIPVIETQTGEMGLHNYFIVLLAALYETDTR